MIQHGRVELGETGTWRGRKVTYWNGTWGDLEELVPDFAIREFRADTGRQANRFLRSVVRLGRDLLDADIPIGVVSPTYGLTPHKDVAEACLWGIQEMGIDPGALRCELGLSEYGEWMNLRIYLPGPLAYTPKDGETLQLRVECFNSVEGSSRLVLFLGWLRWVCSNGMVMGRTTAKLREVHSRGLDTSQIPELISNGIGEAQEEKARMTLWEATALHAAPFAGWVNGELAGAWGKKAACRTYHICRSGWDVDYADPFASGLPTEKPVTHVLRVPGAPAPAANLYDVSQALAWIATRRADVEERAAWQSRIPDLIESLAELTR